MKILWSYLKSAVYNIRRNKAYALFYVLGTALTFVFITIILHVVYLITSDEAPMLYGDRIVTSPSLGYRDKQGNWIYGIYATEQEQFFRSLEGKYELYSFEHPETVLANVSGQAKFTQVDFVGGDYFEMYQFDVQEGRLFDRASADRGDKVAVLRESLAESCFPKGDAVGKKVTVQDVEYEIIGVVADYSLFVAPTDANIWVSYRYNKGLPSHSPSYNLHLLFPEGMPKSRMREAVYNGVVSAMENRGVEIDLSVDDVSTEKEIRIRQNGTSIMLYGVGAALFLLLVIPALNIVTLNFSNAEARASEMALSRAIGATRRSVFGQLMGENLLLVLIGAGIGIVLIFPLLSFLQNVVMGEALSERLSLLANLNGWVLVGQVLPLVLLFAFLSGGIPSYWVAKKNIAHVLKGDEGQDVFGRRRKGLGILLVEQVFIGLVLMLCLSSLLEAVKQYRQPGMLNTDNVFLFALSPHHGLDGESTQAVKRANQLAFEHLKQHPSVEAACVSSQLLPYMRSEVFYFSDTIRIDGKKITYLLKYVEPEVLSVLDIRLEEGKWFTGEDRLEDGSTPVVVTRQLVDAVGWTDAINKKFTRRGHPCTVIGVVEGVKQAAFSESPVAILCPMHDNIPLGMVEYAFKARKGQENDFCNACEKEFQQSNVQGKAELMLFSLNDQKESFMFNTMFSVVAQAVPVLFLFFFAFIGTFGIFWLQSEKRLKEYALRLALGATRKQLLGMVIGESLAVSALASLPAVLLSFFIFDLTWVNVCAVVATVVLMALFSVFSACYPAYKVSKVNPAEALHYE